ncbi:MAG: LolA family protein [Candidatus Binatia bacterium]
MNRRPPGFPSNYLAVLVVVALTAGFAGCSTVSTPPAPALPAREWQRTELIQSLTERQSQFRSLRALARVEYAGPDGKQGFQEAVVVQRPDRLRLETLTMLGAVLIVTVNDAEIIGYHVREGIMVRGKQSKANLLRYTQIPLELDEITAVLLGLPPVDLSAPWQQEGNALVFSPKGQKRDVIAFEAQQPVPTQWERFNGDGAVEIRVSFADYVATPPGHFPTRIIMEAPLQNRKLEVRYQEPELNAALSPELFTQQKPGHVQELPIEALGG